jgi:hypothetical protein
LLFLCFFFFCCWVPVFWLFALLVSVFWGLPPPPPPPPDFLGCAEIDNVAFADYPSCRKGPQHRDEARNVTMANCHREV